jgi:hypothetical protein
LAQAQNGSSLIIEEIKMTIIINGTNTPTAGAVAVGDGTTLNFTAAGTAGQFLQSNGASVPTWATAATGTVTSASVVSANGFAGTVATSTTTPAITLTTSITGIIKGNGTALSAATAGTDYVTPTGTETLTNKTLTNPIVTDYVETLNAIGTVTSSNTLSLTGGTVQTATLTASTACTFTMPTATAGKSFVLLLKQAASTGNGTATFTGVKWGTSGAPTITAGAGKMDILTFIADGTNWYGSIAQGYTP